MWIHNVLLLVLILCIVLVSEETEAYNLVQLILLVPECYLHKMLNIRFWIFKLIFLRIRSSCSQMFFKIGALKNFVSSEFCEIFKNTLFYWTPPVAVSAERTFHWLKHFSQPTIIWVDIYILTMFYENITFILTLFVRVLAQKFTPNSKTNGPENLKFGELVDW